MNTTRILHAAQVNRIQRRGSWRSPLSMSAASLLLAGVMLTSGKAVAQPAAALPFGLISEAEFAHRFQQEVVPLWNGQVKRGEFIGTGGLKLAYASAMVPNERAAVVIVTGRTENILKYQEVVADLVRQGYSAYVYDHRGQGFSSRLLPNEREKGHVVAFEDYVDDLQTFITDVVRPNSHKTLLVLAHSMGGGIASRHLQRFPGTFAAAALSSPMHQPNAKILISVDSSCDWFKATSWFFVESWAGGKPRPYAHTAYDDVSNEYTHSAVRWAQVLKVEDDHVDVRLGGPTRGWVSEACAASDRLIAEADKTTTPVLVLQAGADTAVTPEGQTAFCSALARGTSRSCEGGGPRQIADARHELLIEADRYRVPAMTAIFEFFGRHHGSP
jgi:lysophospholipase